MLMQDILKYKDGIYYNYDFIEKLKMLPINETLVLDEKNKLDYIAYEKYGDYNYWWIIAYYNNIIDPIDYPIPLTIGLPSKDDITEFLLEYTKEE